VRRQLFSAASNLCSAIGGRVAMCSKALFLVLLQLHAQQEDKPLKEMVAQAMDRLAIGSEHTHIKH
jgi:hypothetical protein